MALDKLFTARTVIIILVMEMIMAMSIVMSMEISISIAMLFLLKRKWGILKIDHLVDIGGERGWLLGKNKIYC